MDRVSKLGFEVETCGRCGGSGHYSYNRTYGTKCFDCAGSGVRYTKRGKVAFAMFRESLKVPASEVKVGDTFECLLVANSGATATKFYEVVEVRDQPMKFTNESGEVISHPALMIICKDGRGEIHGTHTFPTSLVRKGLTQEEKAPKLEAALEYQKTLTKTGAVRKR